MIILLLGESGVGKTSFCNACINNDACATYNPTSSSAVSPHSLYSPTIGLDIHEKLQNIPGSGGVVIPIQLWDIGGNSLNDRNLANAIVQADVILLFYDITHLGSFYRLESILKTIRTVLGLKQIGIQQDTKESNGGAPSRDIRMPFLCLLASKSDLENQRVVVQDFHQEFFTRGQFNSSFSMCSSKPDVIRQWLITVIQETSGTVCDTLQSQYQLNKVKTTNRRPRAHSLIKELKGAREMRDNDEEMPRGGNGCIIQ